MTATHQETHTFFGKSGKGADKIKFYGWTLSGDAAGQFRMIPKALLRVDSDAYQRNIRLEKVRAIAANWSWIGCGVLLVAERPDGSLWTMDGQHRLGGANARSDIDLLPCMVYRVAAVGEEAGGFLRSNTLRKPLTSVDKYKALLTTGDPVAQRVAELAEAAGRSVSSASSPSTISCISALISLIQKCPDALDRAWPLIYRLAEGHNLGHVLVEGIVYIEAHLAEGQSLSHTKWSERVLRIGIEEILAGAKRSVLFRQMAGAKNQAEGMLQTINKGIRNYPLMLKGVGDDDSTT